MLKLFRTDRTKLSINPSPTLIQNEYYSYLVISIETFNTPHLGETMVDYQEIRESAAYTPLLRAHNTNWDAAALFANNSHYHHHQS